MVAKFETVKLGKMVKVLFFLNLMADLDVDLVLEYTHKYAIKPW